MMNSTPEFGFPRTALPPEQQSSKPSPVAQPSRARPTPLPKRPKGRWFIGFILLAGCLAAGLQIWQTFLRYRAYGVVAGNVLQVPAPWEGVAVSYHIREGEKARQGQLLMTLENPELRQKYARLSDELHTAQASLEAEAVKVRWQIAFHLDQANGAAVRHIDALGQMAQDHAKVDRLHAELARTDRLFRNKAISVEEVERLRFEARGEEQKLEKVEAATFLQEGQTALTRLLLARTGNLATDLKNDGQEQLRPFASRISGLLSERARVEQEMARGRILAPCHGLVVKMHRLSGELCRAGEPVLSFLEEGSLQVVLYMPQKHTAGWKPQDEVDVQLEPYDSPLSCSVVRLGDRFEEAPASIKRHYFADERLLPFFMQPKPDAARWFALRLGGVVKLPH
jgi:multidrug resistance efflux pump